MRNVLICLFFICLRSGKQKWISMRKETKKIFLWLANFYEISRSKANDFLRTSIEKFETIENKREVNFDFVSFSQEFFLVSAMPRRISSTDLCTTFTDFNNVSTLLSRNVRLSKRWDKTLWSSLIFVFGSKRKLPVSIRLGQRPFWKQSKNSKAFVIYDWPKSCVTTKLKNFVDNTIFNWRFSIVLIC